VEIVTSKKNRYVVEINVKEKLSIMKV